MDPREPDLLVDPVERRRGDCEVEVVLELGLLEGAPADLDAAAETLAEEGGERAVGLDPDQRVGAELDEPPRRLARPRPDLEHLGAGTEATALAEHVVDLLCVARAPALVGCGVEAEEPPPLVAPEVRHQSQGGELCVQRPPTIVATTSTESSSSGGQSSGSCESTTRSAR